MKIKFIILILFCSGIIHSQEQQITKDFKLDTLGCIGLRAKYVANEDSLQKALKGKTRVEIIQLLGDPDTYWLKGIKSVFKEKNIDKTQKWDMFEYIIRSELCKEKNDNIKIYKISISFNRKGIATGIGWYTKNAK